MLSWDKLVEATVGQIKNATHDMLVWCMTCGEFIHEAPYEEMFWEIRNLKAFPPWKVATYKHWAENRDHEILIDRIDPRGGGHKLLSEMFNKQGLDDRTIQYNLEYQRLISEEQWGDADNRERVLQLDDDFNDGVPFEERRRF